MVSTFSESETTLDFRRSIRVEFEGGVRVRFPRSSPKRDQTRRSTGQRDGTLELQGGEHKYPLKCFHLLLIGSFLFQHRKRLSFHVLPSQSR